MTCRREAFLAAIALVATSIMVFSARAQEESRWKKVFEKSLAGNDDVLYFVSGASVRQMVAFGRALMLNPDLLLLDEPSAGLAPKLVEDIITKLQGINMQGVSLLLIEQNVRRALELCDRGYVLDGGKTALEGSSEELLSSKRVQEIYMGGAELE